MASKTREVHLERGTPLLNECKKNAIKIISLWRNIYFNIFHFITRLYKHAQKLSEGEFTEQVLEPLTKKMAPEIIELAKAEFTAQYLEQERQFKEQVPSKGGDLLIRGLGAYLGGPAGFAGADSLLKMADQNAEKEAQKRKVPFPVLRHPHQ